MKEDSFLRNRIDTFLDPFMLLLEALLVDGAHFWVTRAPWSVVTHPSYDFDFPANAALFQFKYWIVSFKYWRICCTNITSLPAFYYSCALFYIFLLFRFIFFLVGYWLRSPTRVIFSKELRWFVGFKHAFIFSTCCIAWWQCGKNYSINK